MPENNSLSALTPRRYRPGLFSLDISSLGIKDTQQQLEHPLFSLSKKPDLGIRKQHLTSGVTIEIVPSALGRPTIWDKDLLIFAISDLRSRMERGEAISPRIRFHTADVIEFCQRIKGGSAYARLNRALMRLAGALIKTNVRTGGIEATDYFHIIDKATIKRQYDKPDGRLIYCEFTLSDWLFRAVQNDSEILTLHPDYFRLRRALDRRLYEIARKHCGRQAEWAIGIEKLYDKSGSGSDLRKSSGLRKFRFELRRIADSAGDQRDLLEYDVALRAGRRGQELVVFRRRAGSCLARDPTVHPPAAIRLADSVAAEARRCHGESVDLAAAERAWTAWMSQKQIRPVNPEAMFLSFLDSWVAGQEAVDPTRAAAPPDSWITTVTTAWWESLDDAARQSWRVRIGQRTELADGTGWFRDDPSIAADAFAQVCPKSQPPTTLPGSVIAAAAEQAGIPPAEIAPEHAAFSRFVMASVAERPYLDGVWRSQLPHMVQAFTAQRAAAAPETPPAAPESRAGPDRLHPDDPAVIALIARYYRYPPAVVLPMFQSYLRGTGDSPPADPLAALAAWLDDHKEDDVLLNDLVQLMDGLLITPGEPLLPPDGEERVDFDAARWKAAVRRAQAES